MSDACRELPNRSQALLLLDITLHLPLPTHVTNEQNPALNLAICANLARNHLELTGYRAIRHDFMPHSLG